MPESMARAGFFYQTDVCDLQDIGIFYFRGNVHYLIVLDIAHASTCTTYVEIRLRMIEHFIISYWHIGNIENVYTRTTTQICRYRA